MFCLTVHSTHFILRLYSNRHMVKNHSESKEGKMLSPLHGLLFNLASKDLLYAPSHRLASTYHGLCYTSLGSLAWNEKIAPWVHPMKDRSDDPTHHERTLLPRTTNTPCPETLPQSYISLLRGQRTHQYISFGRRDN